MDLTRLYNLTTPELREEAERLGVADTYAMSRGQLIHAIREKAGEHRPEGLLGRVFGFAKWAIQAAGETAAARAGIESEPAPAAEAEAVAETGAVAEPAAEPEAVAVAVAEPAAEPAPVSASIADSAPEHEVESVNAAATALGSEAAIVKPIESESTAETGTSSRPPAGVFSNDATLFDEPFPTRTMARILAEQGHFKRALAIYARLLDREPADSELVAEASAVRAQARARRPHAPP